MRLCEWCDSSGFPLCVLNHFLHIGSIEFCRRVWRSIYHPGTPGGAVPVVVLKPLHINSATHTGALTYVGWLDLCSGLWRHVQTAHLLLALLHLLRHNSLSFLLVHRVWWLHVIPSIAPPNLDLTRGLISQGNWKQMCECTFNSCLAAVLAVGLVTVSAVAVGAAVIIAQLQL